MKFLCRAAAIFCIGSPLLAFGQTEMQGKVTTNSAYRLPVALEELEWSGGGK